MRPPFFSTNVGNPTWRTTALIAVVLILFLSPLVFAGGKAEASGSQERTSKPSYPMTLTDGLGETVIIEQEPQRIASLTLFTDEVLFDLVDTNRLIAITSFAADEAYSNVTDRAAEVEMQLDLNVETLVELKPDIVFTANWSDPGKIEQARRAGLTVYIINSPVTIKGIQDEILNLGHILNATDQAQAIVDNMNETLAFVTQSLEGITADERRSAMDYNNWGSSSATGSSWNAILEAAGVENAVAVFDADDYGQVPISKELLVELDPDVIFLPGWIWGDPEGAKSFERAVRDDPALQTLTAIQEDKIYLVPENLKSTYSQYVSKTVLMVARLVYPEYIQ